MEQRQPLIPISDAADPARQARLQQRLAATLGFADRAPFAGADVTAGTENELLATVSGGAAGVDLPRRLLSSPHAHALSPAARHALGQWLVEDDDSAWEHSWLRIDRARLHVQARAQLDRDLAGRADRGDFEQAGGVVRLPASYVLRLALADAGAGLRLSPQVVARVGECFLNDNTAPEIISTHIVSGRDGRLGQAVARENAQRFLLVQLLSAYANRQFGLDASDQSLRVYGAPNPPPRLKRLSRLLPADYYRELFMNPCLAGFRDGAAKRGYMHLCHETLSHSRQHARARLVAAGIARAAVVEPLVCDTSLLNNGTHLSLGSRLLSAAYAEPGAAAAEKYLGDLVAKIVEHYLPLFVGLYSAAPARLAPADLKPERALGFLPNELGTPFLRLTWQSWKRKAGLLAALKGDMLPDARLLDYFAALPSLPDQPALDGRMENGDRLKALLESQGLYDRRMTVYALYRLRERARMGFSGFEGRHYSLFASFIDDLAPAADLQALITAVAYRAVAAGTVTHAQIPDAPETESERRQLFFAAAVGLPVAYVRRTTRNRFLLRVLARTERTRPSKRHTQYYKVYLDDYRAALARVLAEDAEPLLDTAGRTVLDDLRARIAHPDERGAAAGLGRGILAELGAKTPMDVEAGAFNAAAERYYRDTLRRRQLHEGIEACALQLRDSVRAALDRQQRPLLQALHTLAGGRHPGEYLAQTRNAVLRETADLDTLRAWIGLVLANVAIADRRDD
jgi:hypothetical protein